MKSLMALLKLGGPAIGAGLLIVACGGGGDATATPAPQATATPRPAATPTSAAVAAPTAPPTAAPLATAAPTATQVPGAPPTPTATPRPVPTPTPTPIPPTPTPIKQLPKRGGTVRFYLPTDPVTLDPTKLESYPTWYTMDLAWSNLVQYKSDFYTQAEFKGDLADRWEVNSGGDVYTFFLNPKSRFQNLPPLNGRPVTAQDVKWTFELFLNPDYGSQIGSARLSAVKEVTAINDKTVQLRLKEPANNLLYDIAWGTAKIHARELLDQKLFGTEKGIVGSGAFIFDRWEKGSAIKMKRSPNYWLDGVDGQALPYLDAYDAVIVPDNQTHVAAIRSGQLDFASITGVSPQSITAPLRGIQGLSAVDTHPMNTHIIGFQLETGLMRDVRFRRALLKGVDMNLIMTNGTQAPQMPIESFVYSVAGDLAYSQDKLKKVFTRDVNEGKRLLAEAGVTPGTEIELLLMFNRPPYSLVAAIVKQNWEQLGLKVNLVTGPDAETLPRESSGRFFARMGALNSQGDPVAQIRNTWRTGAGRNFDRYANPKADALMDQAKAEFDKTRLKQLLDQAQDLMWEEVPGIPVSPGTTTQAQWDRLKDFKNQYAWGNQGLTYAWLDKN